MEKFKVLRVTFKSGSTYAFYGKTKKEAIAAYKAKFGDFKGVASNWSEEEI